MKPVVFLLYNMWGRSLCQLHLCILNSHDDLKKNPNVHVIQVKMFILKPLK